MITEEEVKQILLSSPMVLPSNPSQSGLGAMAIKELFYKYIRVLVGVINTHLEILKSTTQNELDAHNEGSLAHADLRQIARELDAKIQESYTMLLQELDEHNSTEASHPALVGWLQRLERDVQDAHNLASGKSKIYPVNDVYEMLGMLTDDLNVGDKFVLATQGVPDFILFEKNSTRADAQALSSLEIMLGLTLEAGKFYICNGYLLVATECGIDTGLFARKEELEEVNAELLTKEPIFKKQNEYENEVLLCDKTEHNLGLKTSIKLTMPTKYNYDFETIVTFRSGAEPTVIEAPSDILFIQDDCTYGRLEPVSNRIYEISIKMVCGLLTARVGSVDYEVLA
jgi:hypothetical protein